MSIAQLRATRFSPHLIVVALVLAAVAALALTLAPAKGAAFDTRVYFDVDNNDAESFSAVPTANTSATANSGTDVQTGAITATGNTGTAAAAGSLEFVTETGVAVAGSAVNVQVTTVRGFIGSISGPKVTSYTVAASATATEEATVVVQIFGNNDIGAGAVTADNQRGAGTNVAGTLTVLGPVGNVLLTIPLVDRLLTATTATAGTGNVMGTAPTATVTDTLGAVYPNGQAVLFQSSNTAAGNFTTPGTVAESIAIAGGAGVSTSSGFTGGATGGVVTNITASIGGVTSNVIEVRVGGTVAALATTLAHVGSQTALGTGAGGATGVVIGGQIFAAGLVDTTAVATPLADLVVITVTATDSTGGATESGNALTLTDTSTNAALITNAAAGAAEEQNPLSTLSAANSLAVGAVNGQADGTLDMGQSSLGGAIPVTLGTHSLRVTQVIGTSTVTAPTVDLLVSGPAAAITAPSFTINTAQAASLAPGQTATVSVTVTDSAGRIVPDGTGITFNATGAATWTNGAAAITPAAGTSNGIATAVLLPTGTAINVTVTAFAVGNATVAKSNSIQMVQAQAGAQAATSVTVEAGATELAVGESTTVTATVLDQNSAALANAQVRFTEGVGSASIDSNVKLTNASGQASATFTADEPGNRLITATVVNITGGVIVETSVSGSVNILVTGEAPTPTPTPTELTLEAGGQFVFWQLGPATASQVFATVKIAWLWDPDAFSWTSFIPQLGITDFDIADGDFLWVVAFTATTIEF